MLREGLHYNPYFPGGAIGMAKQLHDGAVEYFDGAAPAPFLPPELGMGPNYRP